MQKEQTISLSLIFLFSFCGICEFCYIGLGFAKIAEMYPEDND